MDRLISARAMTDIATKVVPGTAGPLPTLPSPPRPSRPASICCAAAVRHCLVAPAASSLCCGALGEERVRRGALGSILPRPAARGSRRGSQDGTNALYTASERGCTAVVDRLIAARADVESRFKARPRVLA